MYQFEAKTLLLCMNLELGVVQGLKGKRYRHNFAFLVMYIVHLCIHRYKGMDNEKKTLFISLDRIVVSTTYIYYLVLEPKSRCLPIAALKGLKNVIRVSKGTKIGIEKAKTGAKIFKRLSTNP